MQRFLLAGIALFFTQAAISQINYYGSSHFNTPLNVTWDSATARNILWVEGDFLSSSSAVTTAFTNAFAANQFIDDELKQDVIKRLKMLNRYGQEFDFGITYGRHASLPLLKESIFYISLKQRTHTNFLFTDDLFKLVFMGTGIYSDEEAVLTQSNFSRYRYNQLQAGVTKTFKTAAAEKSIGVAFSFLQGITHVSLDIPRGTFFIDDEAEYIDADLLLQGRFSDTSSQRFTDFNGAGAATDIYFSYKKENYRFHLLATDIGFISWGKESNSFTLDTAFRYEGIQIEDLFAADNDFFANVNEDSLLPRMDEQKGSYTTALPVKINLEASKIFKEGYLMFSFGGIYTIKANYKPLIYLKTDYRLRSSFSASFFAGYGGFTTYHFGAELQKSISDKILIIAGSQDLQGFLIPNAATAQSVYIRTFFAF